MAQAIEIVIHGIDMEVEVDVTAGEKGSRDKWGAQENPDSDRDMDILKVTVGINQGETEIEITSLISAEVIEEIRERCWNVLDDQGEPDEPDYERDDSRWDESKKPSEFAKLMGLLK
jgi:hypothetical protein